MRNPPTHAPWEDQKNCVDPIFFHQLSQEGTYHLDSRHLSWKCCCKSVSPSNSSFHFVNLEDIIKPVFSGPLFQILWLLFQLTEHKAPVQDIVYVLQGKTMLNKFYGWRMRWIPTWTMILWTSWTAVFKLCKFLRPLLPLQAFFAF